MRPCPCGRRGRVTPRPSRISNQCPIQCPIETKMRWLARYAGNEPAPRWSEPRHLQPLLPFSVNDQPHREAVDIHVSSSAPDPQAPCPPASPGTGRRQPGRRVPRQGRVRGPARHRRRRRRGNRPARRMARLRVRPGVQSRPVAHTLARRRRTPPLNAWLSLRDVRRASLAATLWIESVENPDQTHRARRCHAPGGRDRPDSRCTILASRRPR